MKMHRFMGCALIGGLAVVLVAFSQNYLAAQLGTKVGFLHLQNKTRQIPSASPSPIQARAKTTSSLLIRPSSRISETPTIFADRRAGIADVAFNPDDNEYLVVWESNGLTELNSVNDIYGQRLSGATNERIGIVFRISTLSDGDKNHTSSNPKVVYNRTAHEYVVVWHGSGLFNSPDRFFEIYGRRLSRAGKEIGSDFRISHTTDLGKVNTSFVRSSSQADIAWNSVNNEYLVIWKGMGEPEDVVKTEIYGQRLTTNGELLGRYFRISHTTDQGINFNANAPSIAYNSRDNQYLVVWSGGFKNESQIEIWGKGLSAGGEAIGTRKDFRVSHVADVGSDRRASSPHVVYNSSNNEYFVVFQANGVRGQDNADVYEIFGQRIDAATVAEAGPTDFRISTTVGTGNRATRPSVTFNSAAKEYLVLWRNTMQTGPSEIFGQRISSGGAQIEADFQISTITAVGKDRTVNNSTVTYNTVNGEYFVVWQGNGLPGDKAPKVTEIFGQRLAQGSSQRQ
jgi:hypothetical protein